MWCQKNNPWLMCSFQIQWQYSKADVEAMWIKTDLLVKESLIPSNFHPTVQVMNIQTVF